MRDSALSAPCLRKLDMPTWYLSPRHIPLALFSKRVDSKTKLAIVTAMQENLPTICNAGKPTCNAGKPERSRVYKDSTLESFVSSEAWLFFDLLEVQPTFFECVSPEEWELYSSFQQLQGIVCNLKVINDAAERCVKLYCISCIFIFLSQESNKALQQAH